LETNNSGDTWIFASRFGATVPNLATALVTVYTIGLFSICKLSPGLGNFVKLLVIKVNPV
jgi:hypothetical protein